MEACLLSSSYSPGKTRCLSRFCSKTRPHLRFLSGIGKSGNRLTRMSATSGLSPTSAENSAFDVVVVGAGIIGLTVARRFLMTTDLSVAVVDAAVPCSGATGAGQGYIWMAHRTPGSETWDLCNRSKELWKDLVDELQFHGMDPSQELGWKETGYTWPYYSISDASSSQIFLSLLQLPSQRIYVVPLFQVGKLLKNSSSGMMKSALSSASKVHPIFNMEQTDVQKPTDYILEIFLTYPLKIALRTSEESEVLLSRVKLLSEAGLRAEFLPAGSLVAEEPSLQVRGDWSAAFLPDDFQIDARLAVDFIQKGNRSFGLHGRYGEFFHEPVISVVRSNYDGEVVVVQTSKNILYCKQALVVAIGAWSGSLIQDLFEGSKISFLPRKGHLLILENFQKMQLKHGIMEVGYADHYIASPSSNLSASRVSECKNLSISMTATTDAKGNLFLGSSRQFIGFDNGIDESVVNHILNLAQQFFPALRDLPRQDMLRSRKIRIGHRSYMHDGKPIIGPVPGLPKMFLATGHEGAGLTMAMGTAEMIVDMVLNNVPKIDPMPYSLQGRCCS